MTAAGLYDLVRLREKVEYLQDEVAFLKKSTFLKCPVCDGCGTVPNNFYKKTVKESSSRTQCRTCKGIGAIGLDPSRR